VLSACAADGASCSAGRGVDASGTGGTETLTVAGLAAGTYIFGVDSFYATGDTRSSGGYTLSVTGSFGAVPIVTTTTVTSTPNPSTFGQSVAFTIAVAGTSGTPTGTVNVTVDGAPVSVPALSGGQTTFNSSALAKGSHTVVATYPAQAGYRTSSGTTTQVVNGATTTTSVTASVEPSVSGQSVTFTAHVASGAGTPTGDVVFTIEGSASAPVALDGSGNATITHAFTTPGAYPILAAYGGAANYDPSSGNMLHDVGKAPTTTVLTAAPNPAVSMEAVTLTATVGASGAATGKVTFYVGGSAIGTGTLSGNVATLPYAFAVGSHTLTASYEGDTFFQASDSAPLTEVVGQAGSITTLLSSSNPSVAGQSVTFTASVGRTAGGGIPTGSVTFFDGVATLGTVALDGMGNASLATAALTSGSHAVVATYGGSAELTGSTSNVISQVVNSSGASVAVTSSANPAVRGANVTFTATVTAIGTSGTPSGTVTFSDGATTLGTQTLSGGVATFSTATLSGGSHTINAAYSGDANFNAGNGSLSQTIQPAATTTTLSATPNPSKVGGTVTLVATVTPSASGTPTGTVAFLDGASNLGTATLTGNTATLTTSSLTAGTHSLTAAYAGNADHAASTSSPVSQVIETPSENPADAGAGADGGGGGGEGGTDASVSVLDASVPEGGLPYDAGLPKLPTVNPLTGEDGNCGCEIIGANAADNTRRTLPMLAVLGIALALARRRRS